MIRTVCPYENITSSSDTGLREFLNEITGWYNWGNPLRFVQEIFSAPFTRDAPGSLEKTFRLEEDFVQR